MVGNFIFRAGQALVWANTVQSNNKKINQQIKAVPSTSMFLFSQADRSVAEPPAGTGTS